MRSLWRRGTTARLLLLVWLFALSCIFVRAEAAPHAVPTGGPACAGFTFPYTLAGADNTARVAELREAIDCGNASGSAFNIDLAGQTLVFSDGPYSDTDGANALPIITGTATLINGALERNAAAAPFRFLKARTGAPLHLGNMRFINGHSTMDGGAVLADYVFQAGTTRFENNRADGNGGGLRLRDSGGTMLIGVDFIGNAAVHGAAISHNTSILLLHSHIQDNGDASSLSLLHGISGGGFVSILIENNRLPATGSVLFHYENPIAGRPELRNVTLANNQVQGAMFHATVNLPIAYNTIVWDNQFASLGPVTPLNSIVQGVVGISVDPQFQNASQRNYRLAITSPAIDAGDNAYGFPDFFDLNQNGNTSESMPDLNLDARPVDVPTMADTGNGTAPIIDMGAYEHQGTACYDITFPYTLTAADNTARVAELRQAIDCANVNATADVIDLGGFTLSFLDGPYLPPALMAGNSALPAITSTITLRNGVMRRDGAANAAARFRFLNVADTGNLSVFSMGFHDSIILGGGGAIAASGPLLVRQAHFENNEAINGLGGAVSAQHLTVLQSSFSNNRALGTAAIWTGRQAPSGTEPVTILNSRFEDHGTAGAAQGGVISLSTTGAIRLDHVLLADNVSHTFLIAARSGMIASHLTLARNSTDSALVIGDNASTITNSIVWGNQINGLGNANFSYSLVQGGAPGTGNLDADPLFVDAANGNYTLAAHSPATDSGNNAFVPVDTFDLNNNGHNDDDAPDLADNPRRVDDTGVTDTGTGTAPIVDMGAFERQTGSPPQADLSITKTDGVATAIPGSNVTYTITASNAGPSPVAGATVNDTFAGVLTCTWTCVGAGGGTCPASGAGNINDSVNLPVGSSVTHTANCSISASATGNLINTATVAVPGGTTDPNLANNSATDTDTLTPLPALSINDVSLNEGNAGTTAFNFTVSLSAPALPGGVTFDIATANNTAIAPGDYIAHSLTGQTIPAGSSTYNFTVQVNGDLVFEPNETFFVNVTNVTGATLADGQGLGTINNDDASAGISVNPTSGLVTTEAGGTAQFTVVLDSQPSADVTIGLSSSDTTEGTISPTALTFSTANWNTAQTITITGVDDAIVDGDVAYTINTAAATSADANYNGINPADVSVTNTDNDSAGITVNPTNGLTTTEAGGTAMFTVVLNSEPTADVTIGLSSSDTTEGTVLPSGITFTSANWNIAQTVTVTGVDDAEVDGDVAYSIITAAAVSADANYNDIDPADVALTNTDDDSAGITINPTSGLITTEAGGTAIFTVVLNSQPSANVSIGLSSSDTTEGTVLPASVTFTSANWNTTQTVTITGVDDAEVDGDVVYSIITAAAVSADANYNGINPADVSVTNTDDDSAGITVNPTAGLITTEAGGTASFTVVLNSQPSADVTIGLSSSDTTEGTVSPTALTFTTVNWNTARTVTVTGVDDDEVDGNAAYTIVTAAAVSADANYDGVNPADVGVTNLDNDTAGITVNPTSGLTTTEAGGTATFTVVLNSQPSADVTIGLSSSDTTEGTVAPASLTFTSANWNAAQTVTITGVDDTIADGDIAYTIVTAAAVSTDANYNGVNPADVSVTNTDDDNPGITVHPVSGLVTTEAGGEAQFTVVLDSQPGADVTIPLSSSDTTEGTVAPASLTFTTANWNTAQTVTVKGVADGVNDGDVAYSIVIGPALSDDPAYDGLDPPDVAAINLNGDTTAGGTVPIMVPATGTAALWSLILLLLAASTLTLRRER